MRRMYFNVSGVDPNEGADIVFVRCRDKNPDYDLILGSGHVVIAGACAHLPGVQAGQFSITFPLPDGCAAENIVVTRDKGGKDLLSGVTLTPCLISATFQSGGAIVSDAP